ncbi:MAG: FAD-dependent oxidoreductase [Actinomycetota bacterium]
MAPAADVVVVGAGLGGLACGLDLTEAGRDVLVLERRPVVGGRTASWNDDGMAVESGLHRYLGFFSALTRLLERAGVDVNDMVCWEDEFEVRLPDGGARGILGVAPVYRPLRVLSGFLASPRLLSFRDEASLVPFILAGVRDFLRRPFELDRWSVLDYAQRHRVTERAIRHLLTPLTAGIYFLPPERFSAANLFNLIVPGLPRLPWMRLGVFRGGMTEVMCQPLVQAIGKSGGEVRTGVEVERLAVHDGRVTGVVADGAEIRAEHVVVATSLGRAQPLLREAVGEHPWFAAVLAMPTTPSVTIQLDLDRPAMDADRTVFGPGTATACFSEQSRTTFPGQGRLSVILSPPEPFLEMEPAEVAKTAVADGERLGLPLDGHVTGFRVVSHPQDFPSLEPGHLRHRPSQRTPVPGLVLAGDYTRQRFGVSMEGAVISGQHAARVALGHQRRR